GELLSDIGMTDQHIARQITGWIAALNNSVSEREVGQRVD
ncbi:MAG TPA: 1-deoxy-D-xylulose 5-phosphate synthase, partial [Mycobacterium sp.]